MVTYGTMLTSLKHCGTHGGLFACLINQNAFVASSCLRAVLRSERGANRDFQHVLAHGRQRRGRNPFSCGLQSLLKMQ